MDRGRSRRAGTADLPGDLIADRGIDKRLPWPRELSKPVAEGDCPAPSPECPLPNADILVVSSDKAATVAGRSLSENSRADVCIETGGVEVNSIPAE